MIKFIDVPLNLVSKKLVEELLKNDPQLTSLYLKDRVALVDSIYDFLINSKLTVSCNIERLGEVSVEPITFNGDMIISDTNVIVSDRKLIDSYE